MSNYIETKGVIIPDTATVLAEVEAEYKAIFGDELVTTPDTPQGMMIAAEVQSRINIITNISNFCNQINPNIAEGAWLDAIWRLTGGNRIPASTSKIYAANLTGQSNTIIPAGSLASQSLNGQTWRLITTVQLSAGGIGTGDFECTIDGSVECPAGDLDSPSGVLGWETVSNPTAAVVGTDQESDEQSRSRRVNTLARQAYGTAEAITSRLYSIGSVESVSFRENITNAPAVIDGINLVAHSIWACVDGGSDEEVAQALLDSKSSGSNYNGAVTVNVVDQYSGQTYPVKFDRPTEIPVMCRVTMKAGSGIADPISSVKDAIMRYVDGLLLSESGFTLGTDVSAFELGSAVNVANPSNFVVLVEVALLSGSPSWTSLISIAINEKATLDESNIAVVLV